MITQKEKSKAGVVDRRVMVLRVSIKHSMQAAGLSVLLTVVEKRATIACRHVSTALMVLVVNQLVQG